MYVGYHDANNVSNFGGDPVTLLHLENVLKISYVILYSKICAVLDIMRKWLEEHYFGGDQVTQLNFVLYNTIKWSYQPKHSPSVAK